MTNETKEEIKKSLIGYGLTCFDKEKIIKDIEVIVDTAFFNAVKESTIGDMLERAGISWNVDFI